METFKWIFFIGAIINLLVVTYFYFKSKKTISTQKVCIVLIVVNVLLSPFLAWSINNAIKDIIKEAPPELPYYADTTLPNKDKQIEDDSTSREKVEKKATPKKDIVKENNDKANSDLEKIKNSIKNGDTLEKQGNLYIVKRKDGTVEKYEMVSGIAGFSLIKID